MSESRVAGPVDGYHFHLFVTLLSRSGAFEVEVEAHDSGWTYLSEEFIQDLERGIASGETISSVLSSYGINRGTYYSWLAIGEGRMSRWRDGTPISEDMRVNCRRLCKRVLRAREARLRARRQALR
jgi:hypothetical protein